MKVLGSLPLTGTHQLAAVLRELGLRTVQTPSNIALAHNHDALLDTPVFQSQWLKLIDKTYGAKFIFTTRNIDEWLDECQVFFTRSRSGGESGR